NPIPSRDDFVAKPPFAGRPFATTLPDIRQKRVGSSDTPVRNVRCGTDRALALCLVKYPQSSLPVGMQPAETSSKESRDGQGSFPILRNPQRNARVRREERRPGAEGFRLVHVGRSRYRGRSRRSGKGGAKGVGGRAATRHGVRRAERHLVVRF